MKGDLELETDVNVGEIIIAVEDGDIVKEIDTDGEKDDVQEELEI